LRWEFNVLGTGCKSIVTLIRVRDTTLKSRIHSEEEMKKALQEEWDKITLEEIRERISSMPR